MFFLNIEAVLFGLFSTNSGVSGCFFGFNNGQRFSVFAQ